MIRTTAHVFIWVFILALVCACGATPEDKARYARDAAALEALRAEGRAAPVGVPAALPVTDLVAPRGEIVKLWTESNVMRDPETGCEYLLSASGDLEPRMARFDTDAATFQMGCRPHTWRGPEPR